MTTKISETLDYFKRIKDETYELKNQSFVFFLIVPVLCWVANYTYFQGFGLYHDDWPAMANHTKLALYGGIESPFAWFDIWPQGRPLGWFFLSALGAPARYFGELTYFYIVGYAILTTVSLLIFQIVRLKYGVFLALLVAVLFMTSPADTTKIQLTMNYLAHTGFIFCLLAIFLYQRGLIFFAYVFSALPLLCYEATFFPFVAAPLLTLPLYLWSTWKRQFIHGLLCLLVIAFVITIRVWVFDSALKVNTGVEQKGTIMVFLDGLYRYGLHFFVLFSNGILIGLKATGAMSLALAGLTFGSLFLANRKFPTWNQASLLVAMDLVAVGLILLLLGLVTAGFTDYYPRTQFGGRDTRVYIVAIFGGAMIMSALVPLAGTILKDQKASLFVKSVVITFLVIGVSGNSIKLQKDYVEAWDLGRSVVRSSIELSCDAIPGDIIILVPLEPAWDRSRAIHPYGFGFSTAIADIYSWPGTTVTTIPRIMRGWNNWPKAIVENENGTLIWGKRVLSGFPLFTGGQIKPNSIIHLRGTHRGLVRSNTPILIGGTNVVKPQRSVLNGETCWYRQKPMDAPLAPIVYPDLFTFGQNK